MWCGYSGEPEYNEEKLNLMETSDDTKSNSDEEKTDLNLSRQENLYCCKCSHCFLMSTFRFNKDLLGDNLSAGCVINHEAFNILILNKSALEVTFIKHYCFKSNLTEMK